MLYGLALKAGGLIVLCVAVYAGINTLGRLLNNHINEYLGTRETLMAKQIEVAGIQAHNDYLKQLAEVTGTFRREKDKLMESTHQSLLDARTELLQAQNSWRVEDIRQRASTPVGNADLSIRAARATGRKKELLEKLSDWNTVYEKAGNPD